MRISDWSSDVCSSDLPEISRRSGVNAQPGQRRRKCKAGQGRDDHIEGIGGVAPVCCGIGQGTDYLLHVPECPRPTMGKDQRDRLRPLTRLPDEKKGKSVNCDAVMGEQIGRESCRDSTCQYG